MEQFDNWQDFWDKFLLNRYGKEEVKTEDDLYLQVARTVNRKPVTKEAFDQIIDKIVEDSAFSPDDILVDLCCGNGLFTYELKDKVKQIIGVDFSQSIIDTARQFRSAANIEYHLGGTTDFLKNFRVLCPGIVPGKFLMNDALAYFSVADFESMLSSILAITRDFKFLIRGVPDDDLKWNYYNTEERKAFYKNLQAKGDLTNDGLGTWWLPADIEAVCDKLQLQCVITPQQMPVSDYRMDILISNKPRP